MQLPSTLNTEDQIKRPERISTRNSVWLAANQTTKNLSPNKMKKKLEMDWIEHTLRRRFEDIIVTITTFKKKKQILRIIEVYAIPSYKLCTQINKLKICKEKMD
ncbi:unnamed protein product [Heterobilharzia americana]|nr:unnamed protein product [Heterobilharzia americana]